MMLGQFVCGGGVAEGIADSTLDHLKSSIERFGQRALTFLKSDFDDDARSFSAFCARVFLENACAALVGRLDPFRLIYLANFQAQHNFEYGKASNSGFRWTGDVLPNEKAPEKMWGIDHNFSKVSRALFSDYADHMYWRPAIERTLDAIANDNSEILSEFRQIDPLTYVSNARARCASLYSTLSKGVHWDFFVSTVVMDEGTIKDSIREMFLNISALALASHFVPTSYRSLEGSDAINTYKALREEFQ